MTNPDSKTSFNLVELLRILYKNIRFLITQFVVISILSLLYALYVTPLSFKSSAVIVSPDQFNPLSSFLPAGMTQGLSGIIGASLGGGETTTVIAILNSRNLAEKTIREFDLMDRFSSKTIEDALITFRNHRNIELTEEGTVAFSVEFGTVYFPNDEDHKDIAELSYRTADYMITELDNIYTSLGTQKAKYEREEIEKRYNQNKLDLFEAEENLKAFSQETGIIEIETQAVEAITALAELESSINIERIKLSISEKMFGNESPQMAEQRLLINEMESQFDAYMTRTDSSNNQSIFPSISDTPEYGIRYARLFREVEVQSLIYQFLTQQYEQLKLQEAKDTPSLQFIDVPQLPTKKSAPKRSIMILAIVFAGSILSSLYIIVKELYKDQISSLAREITSK